MKLPDNYHDLPKWEKLKAWVEYRHNHAESLHNQTLLSADAAQMGILRDIYTAMTEMERQERAQALNPTRPRRGKA